MTLRRKLLYHGLVAATGILFISIAALAGLYNVRQRGSDVTRSSAQQFRTLAFTRILQDHGTLLSLASSSSTEAEIAERERALNDTLTILRRVAADVAHPDPLLGRTAVRNTLSDIGAWRNQGIPVSVAVNLSARQLRDHPLAETVSRGFGRRESVLFGWSWRLPKVHA